MHLIKGNEIANLVKAGNLLVSTRESSRENLELIKQHPEIKSQLMTWTKASFLMIQASKRGLLAVSTSMPVKAPPLNGTGVSSSDIKRWKMKNDLLLQNVDGKTPWYIQHYDGGPMERDEPMAVVHVRNMNEKLAKSLSVLYVPPYFIYGTYENVENVLKNEKYRMNGGGGSSSSSSSSSSSGGSATSTLTKVAVIWGCGGWGATQVLAEIARGGWGLVEYNQYVNIRPDSNMSTDFQLDFDWSRMISIAKVAPKSEYTR